MISRQAASTLTVTVLALLILATAPANAQTVETFIDEFSSISYAGNNGTENFSGSWRERGESDGPSSGVVRVVADSRCSGGTGNCLRIGSEAGDIDAFAVDRVTDLESAESATLSFAWRRRASGATNASVRVRVSANGSSWTTLATIPLSGSQSPQSMSFDISSATSSTTTVRFEGQGTGPQDYLLIDNVSIEATSGPETTTTSSTTTTTTTATTTTTTTVPGISTTSTTLLNDPPTSTTTTTAPGEDPSSTTTTGQPEAPTTTDSSSTGSEPSGTPTTSDGAETSPGSEDEDSSSNVATGSDVQEPPSSTAAPVPSNDQTAALPPNEATDNGVSPTIAAVALVQLIGLGALIGVLSLIGVGRGSRGIGS
ncbi:MAG: hypothetical protein ACR2NG_09610 [Acidimicrobiia bacterium]